MTQIVNEKEIRIVSIVVGNTVVNAGPILWEKGKDNIPKVIEYANNINEICCDISSTDDILPKKYTRDDVSIFSNAIVLETSILDGNDNELLIFVKECDITHNVTMSDVKQGNYKILTLVDDGVMYRCIVIPDNDDIQKVEIDNLISDVTVIYDHKVKSIVSHDATRTLITETSTVSISVNNPDIDIQ